MEDKKLKEMCLHLLENCWPVYVTTVDDKGFPQTRAMFNLRNAERFPKLIPFFENHKDDFMLLFTTNTSSTKIENIKSNKAVSVYYCNPDTWWGVMFSGLIEVVEDLDIKKSIWHSEWIKYYLAGFDDPDHTVLQLFPNVARGWTGNSTFKLELGDKK